MTNKDPRPENMPWLSPYIMVKDCEKAIEFYKNAFGFETGGECMKNDEGKITHAQLRHRDGVFMIGQEDAWEGNAKSPNTTGTPSPINLYVYVDDVDQHFNRAKEVGAKVSMELDDMFWGDRMCGFTDLDGYKWNFATFTS